MPNMSCPRVLVADDDPGTRESIALVLRDEGYETLEALTGTETLDTLVLSPAPLVVLLDLLMPGITGFEVLAQVAANDELARRHRYIVMSARPFRLAQQIGPHFAGLLQRLDIPFVEKPFELAELLHIVTRVLRSSHRYSVLR